MSDARRGNGQFASKLDAEQAMEIARSIRDGRTAAEVARDRGLAGSTVRRSKLVAEALRKLDKRAVDAGRQRRQLERNRLLDRHAPDAKIGLADTEHEVRQKLSARAEPGLGRVIGVIATGGRYDSLTDFNSTRCHFFGGGSDGDGYEAVLDANDARRRQRAADRERFGNPDAVVVVRWPNGQTTVDVRDSRDVARACSLVLDACCAGNLDQFDTVRDAIVSPPPGTGTVRFAP